MLRQALSKMQDVFLSSALGEGLKYQQQGHVLNLRFSDGLVKARIKGQHSQIYDVLLDLKSWPSNPARCNCQYKINCKHAAASLFALQVRENFDSLSTTLNKTENSLTDWMRYLPTVAEKEREQKQELSQPMHLIYLMDFDFNKNESYCLISLALAKQLKNSAFGKKVIFNEVTQRRKQHFTEADKEIVATLLLKSAVNGCFHQLPFQSTALLEKIIATGRAYINSTDGREGPALVIGEPLNVDLTWHLSNTGEQHLILASKGEPILPFFLDKAWYVDSKANTMGLLNLPYEKTTLKNLLQTKPVALENAAELAIKMAETTPHLPRPMSYPNRFIHKKPPHPVILFDAVVLNKSSSSHFDESAGNSTQNSNTVLFLAELVFDYEGQIITKNDESTRLIHKDGDDLIEIQRNMLYEKNTQQLAEQILSLRSASIEERLQISSELLKPADLTSFNAPPSVNKSVQKTTYMETNKFVLMHYKHLQDLPRLYTQTIPLLKSHGFRIEFMNPFYQEVIDAEVVEWFSELEETSNDFFAYQLGILIDGKQVSIVPMVIALIPKFHKDSLENLADSERINLPLPDGKLLETNFGRIKPLITFLLQYGTKINKDSKSLALTRYQLLLLQETQQAMRAISARCIGSKVMLHRLEQLSMLNNLPIVAIPRGLKTTLRDYQHLGLNWLQCLRITNFAGVLADDMGLGKTVQTLAHMQVEKEQGRLTKSSLIVAPTSLVVNWFEEAKRFTPDLRVLIFHGSERHTDSFDDFDLVISTYGLIQRDKSRFIAYPFYYLILDEAQFIKNSRTKTTQIIQQIQAAHRLCLSGTPLENHLGELWSLFNFLMPGLLGDTKAFNQFFRIPIEKHANIEKRALLAKRVQPFMLRRTKNEVARELPIKTEITRKIELIGTQRDLYEAIRISMEKKVRAAIAKQGFAKSHILLLDALLKLRQVCCDPRLLSIPEAKIATGVSAKLDAFSELITSLMEEGRRVLVFSQFTTMLKLIETSLINSGYQYLKLTGQTKNRQALVNTFQAGSVPIFLISLKAGGTGLNLTRADTVIHYDPWWNPAVEDQATDRSHRIGQENPVFVYKLITSGTVEEAILLMQDKKRQLFEGILSNCPTKIGFTRDEIEQFFMPLEEMLY